MVRQRGGAAGGAGSPAGERTVPAGASVGVAVLALLAALSVGGTAGAAAATPPPATGAPGLQALGSVPVGQLPHAIAVDPVLHQVYVANATSDTVTVLRSEGGRATPVVVTTIDLRSSPWQVAVDPTTHDVYVTTFSETMAVIDESGDARTNTVTSTVDVGFGGVALAVDPSSHQVYVGVEPNAAIGVRAHVAVVDESGGPRTGTVVATIPVGDGDYLPGLAVDPSTGYLYVLDDTGTSGGTVLVVDESQDARRGTVVAETGVGRQIAGAVVDPTTHAVYVASTYGAAVLDGTVSVIDGNPGPAVGTVSDTIDLGNDHPNMVGMDPATHVLYYSTGVFPGRVRALDVAGDRGRGRILTSASVTFPWALAVDPATDDVFVTDLWSNDVVALSPAVATEAAPVSVNGRPPPGATGAAYHYGFTVTGAPEPTVALSGGALPPGLHLGARGALTGTPTTAGDYTFTLTATNATAQPASATFRLEVVGPPADLALTLLGPVRALDGSRLTETVTVTNRGPAPSGGTVVEVALPPGLTVMSAPGATAVAGGLCWTDPSLTVGASATHVIGLAVGDHSVGSVTIGGIVVSNVDYTSDTTPTDNVAIHTVQLG